MIYDDLISELAILLLLFFFPSWLKCFVYEFFQGLPIQYTSLLLYCVKTFLFSICKFIAITFPTSGGVAHCAGSA